MSLTQCRSCGSDQCLFDLGYCPSCAYEMDLITEEEFNEFLEDE